MKIFKYSLKAVLKNTFKELIMKRIIDILIQRFVFDYRNTIHCTTGFTPVVMLKKPPKARLCLLIPPNIGQNITSSQDNQIKNFKGQRN